MFWNKISPLYDLFENVYNRKVYKGTGLKVAEFKRQFDLDAYKKFFAEMGYKDVRYYVVEGRMPCAIAVFTRN